MCARGNDRISQLVCIRQGTHEAGTRHSIPVSGAGCTREQIHFNRRFHPDARKPTPPAALNRMPLTLYATRPTPSSFCSTTVHDVFRSSHAPRSTIGRRGPGIAARCSRLNPPPLPQRRLFAVWPPTVAATAAASRWGRHFRNFGYGDHGYGFEPDSHE